MQKSINGVKKNYRVFQEERDKTRHRRSAMLRKKVLYTFVQFYNIYTILAIKNYIIAGFL